jgi:hypothetical protein
MTATLKANLTSLVELSKTSDRAIDYLAELLRQTTEPRDIQMVKLAIRNAERNARTYGL